MALRWVLAGMCLGLAACAPETPNAEPQIETILDDAVMRGLEARTGARIGLALVAANGELLKSWRGDERFALCSTFKLALGAAVLERVEAGELAMDDAIAFDESDVLDYAPIVAPRVREGSMTVGELAGAISTHSDNSAANLLLEEIGGPEALTEFFRRQGDAATRLDRIEPELNENAQDDVRDTTTPQAMAGLVQRLVLGDALGEEARTRLAEWAVANTTGDNRIRAGIPEGWRVGDKTGTCGYDEDGAVNDVAIVWPPIEPPFVLAVYIDRPTAAREEVEASIAEIGELAAFYMSERYAQQ